MKRCPNCGAANSDLHPNCGVCDHDMSNEISQKLEEIALENQPIQQVSGKRSIWTRAVILVTGPAVVGLGLYIMSSDNPFGSLITIGGLVVTLVVVGSGGRSISGARRMESGGAGREPSLSGGEDPLLQMRARLIMESEERKANEERARKKTRRVLMKGGVLVATVPNEKLSNYLSLASFFGTLKLPGIGKAYSRFRNKRLHHFHCESLGWWAKELTSLGFYPITLTEHLPNRAVVIWDIMAIMAYPISYLGRPKRFAPFLVALERATRALRFSMINSLAPTFLPNRSGGAVLAIVATKLS